MKIIISRKGFDSEYGQIPSPILPDGTLLSLPIPDREDQSRIRYSDLASVNGHSPAKLVKDLTKGRISKLKQTHFDPDLRAGMLPRNPGWRPLFGPHPKSHTHMTKNQGVEVGDLILFFGLFREVYLANGTYQFVRSAPKLHVLFGWFQIDAMLPAGLEHRKDAPKWAQYHPHFQGDWENNCVYVSRKQLSISGLRMRFSGGGAFEKYSDALRLTAPDCSQSVWQLPRSIFPSRGQLLFSYHSDPKLWTRTAKHTRLRTRGKWQEAVLHCDEYPSAITWARQIMTHAA